MIKNSLTVLCLICFLQVPTASSKAGGPQCIELFRHSIDANIFADLVHAAIILASTGNSNLVHPDLLNQLTKIVELKKGQKLTDAAVMQELLKRLNGQTPGVVDSELATYLVQIRNFLEPEQKPTYKYEHDRFQNSWGIKLLPDNDPVFKEARYLTLMLKMAHNSAIGGYATGRLSYEIASEFADRWRQVTKTSPPSFFTITGSDALSAIVTEYGKENIMYFKGMWMGSRGAATRYDLADNQVLLGPYVNEPPQHLKLTKNQSVKIEKIENKVFAMLKERLAQDKLKAIFLEPILGAGVDNPGGGVMFFRLSFLKKLQSFAKKNDVAIVADEILTGGGRTGNFFAFQNYNGFQPDHIVFGKGLQIAGITSIQSNNSRFKGFFGSGTTIHQYPEPMLKAIQLLKKIEEEDLLTNSRVVGDYFLKRLREYDPKARGLGLFLFSYYSGPAMGRFLPHLTLTKKQVDEYFSEEDEKNN